MKGLTNRQNRNSIRVYHSRGVNKENVNELYRKIIKINYVDSVIIEIKYYICRSKCKVELVTSKKRHYKESYQGVPHQPNYGFTLNNFIIYGRE
jgi:hypothetical protein